jgi:hypothetical protein
VPKAAPIQTSFSAGEFSPLTQGRVDAERYKQGLATELNYLPTLQGPMIRRPGTKYVTNVKDSTNPPTLIPFQFNQTQAYVLEFGHQYIRFYQNNGQLVAPTSTCYKVNGDVVDPGALVAVSFYAVRDVGTSVPNYPEYSGESITAYSNLTLNAPLEMASPYSINDVAQIKFAQNADTLYLTHPNYPVYKLQRFGTTDWVLKRVLFKDGPYLRQNSYYTTGDSVAITFQPTGAQSGTLYAGPANTITGCANNGAGLIRVTTSTAHNRSTGDKVFIIGVLGTSEANNDPTGAAFGWYWRITVIDSTHFDLVGSTFTHAYTSGGFAYPAFFDLTSSIPNNLGDTYRSIRLIASGVVYSGIITTVLDPARALFILSAPIATGTPVISNWFFGEWVYTKKWGANYPACVSFHQGRLVFAGAPAQPQEVNGSVPFDYENFQPTEVSLSTGGSLVVTDSDALQFTLSSSDINAIRWLKSESQGLLAGTQSSEWIMQASTSNQALTPTNFNASQTSYFGSANVDAVQAGNATLHIQRAQRKVRELNYFFQVGTFRSTDLTELCEHLTLPTITKLAVQKETQPIVWALRSDGNFLSMVYNRDDTTLKAGWSRHQLGGQSDSAGTTPVIKSIAVIPSQDGTFDQLWMVVNRWINGASVGTVEYMTKPYDSSVAQDDSYHFDCGATYSGLMDQTLFAITGVTRGATTTIVGPHPFSNGDQIRFSSVVGLNKSTTDLDGNVTITNLVNGKTFYVAGVTGLSYNIVDAQGNNIDSTGYSAWVSGSLVSKLVTTISGLTWLKNETVSILADGGIHPDVVVSNSGGITLSFPAAKVQIGYKYNSDGQNLRLEAGAADGSSIGKTRRPSRVAFMLRWVGDFAFGADFNSLRPMPIEQADQQQADNATPLFNGIYRDGIEAAYDFEGQVCWRQNSGLPGMIQAITVFEDEIDV